MITQKQLDDFSEKCIASFDKFFHYMIGIEEFSELIKAISKIERTVHTRKLDVIKYTNCINNLIEELADCKIMINTISRLYAISDYDIDLVMKEKIKRGYYRIKIVKDE